MMGWLNPPALKRYNLWTQITIVSTCFHVIELYKEMQQRVWAICISDQPVNVDSCRDSKLQIFPNVEFASLLFMLLCYVIVLIIFELITKLAWNIYLAW